jgi:hypothetical protein
MGRTGAASSVPVAHRAHSIVMQYVFNSRCICNNYFNGNNDANDGAKIVHFLVWADETAIKKSPALTSGTLNFMNRICIEKCNISFDGAKDGIFYLITKFLTEKNSIIMHFLPFLEGPCRHCSWHVE